MGAYVIDEIYTKGEYILADFDKMQNFLDTIFMNDENAKEKINQTGLTFDQLRVINTLIISALRAYDSEVKNE